MNATRAIELRDPSKRRGRNAQTAFFNVDQLRGGRVTYHQRPAPGCEVAFISCFDRLREVCVGAPRDAIAVFAMDSRGVAGHAVIRGRSNAIQTAIIGRHTCTDLFLPDDPQLSLRHLALVMHPHSAGMPLRWQLIDLRTGLQFHDERGCLLEHIAADGPVFIQVGQHSLLFLPLDHDYPWSEGPLSCWNALPPRTYTAAERFVVPRRRRRAGAPGDTAVQTLPGPRFPSESDRILTDSRVGYLTVRSGRGSIELPLTERMLASGVLLGRYHRCDNRLGVLDDDNVSRVHAILLDVGGQLWAVDAGSTNGLWMGRQKVRHARLRPGTRVVLGRKTATIHFRYA